MGGKRPDQYRIAPAEGGATDYKYYPEATHGRDQDLDTAGDKQRLAQSEQNAMQDMEDGSARASGGLPFPPDVPAPSADVRRGHKADEDEEDTPGAGDARPGRENPLV